ncbi:class Ib ribonucleoside-diphosphate reductase assembly flavoprotein NrdI [Niallia alba]|uniref:ribonucleotide reductase stimulatory protein n=1 Tax=Niallia alba TaxID=2729105 RepID=UPI002E205D00|nr:class Ib ribonucleoside-diphosphate reductase assembly flavoprotein NrdI [Niallia alba]
MRLVYLSLTGNVKEFVSKTGMESIELDFFDPLIEVDEDYVIVVPSYDDNITDTISEFIDYKSNHRYLKGFAGSGSLNYNEHFCFNAKDLSMKYNKPLIYKFEFCGRDIDVINFKKEVKLLGITRTSEEN